MASDAERPESPTKEALARMRRGALLPALEVLETAARAGSLDAEGETLRFLLYRQTGAEAQALEVATRRLAGPLTPLERSTWLLRSGLVLSALGRKNEAARALQEVLKAAAAEDHTQAARKALLDLARS